jgi:predicted PurR-regulated permease PerM
VSDHVARASLQEPVVAASRLFIAVVIVLALVWGRPVLMPIALAILLTFLLNPIVRFLQKVGIGRLPSVILAVTTVGIAVTSIGFIGSRQISMLLGELPANTAKIRTKVKALKAVVSGPTVVAFEDMIEEIGREFQVTQANAADPASETETEPESSPTVIRAVVPNPNSERPWNLLTGYLGSAFEAMAMFAFALVLLVFFLLEREGLRDRVVLLAGRTRLTLTSKALEDATNRVSRYILMVAIVNGSFGLTLTVGLFLLGLQYAILWGCLAALLRFIPYIGPWVGAVFPIAMSLALSEGWWQPIGVFLFVLAVELVVNNVVEPVVFGRTIGVAPAALLISAACWLYLWGPVGLILSAPFAVCLVVIGKNIPQLQFLNVLLGDEPALSTDVGFYQRLLEKNQQQATAMVAREMSSADSSEVQDKLLIPALNFARRDLHRGHISDEECSGLLGVLHQAFVTAKQQQVPATSSQKPESSSSVNRPEGRQLTLQGCAADGDVDRAAILMLRENIDPGMWKIDCVPEGMLTSEVIERIVKQAPAVICISSLPPGNIAHARYLCKRLRAAAPDTPIVVGRWGERRIRTLDHERLLEAGATVVLTSIQETRKWLSSHYPILDQASPGTADGSANAIPELVPALLT